MCWWWEEPATWGTSSCAGCWRRATACAFSTAALRARRGARRRLRGARLRVRPRRPRDPARPRARRSKGSPTSSCWRRSSATRSRARTRSLTGRSTSRAARPLFDGRSRARDRPLRLHLHLQQLRPARRATSRRPRSPSWRPLSLYAETKVEFEQHVLGAGRDGDFCPTVLRIATAYGLSPADALRPDDLRVHPHARDRRGAAWSTTPTPGGPTATSTTSPRRSDRPRRARGDGRAARSSTSATPTRTTRSGWSSTPSRSTSAARASVQFTEGGVDARNYRVSFDKIRDALGFEPD